MINIETSLRESVDSYQHFLQQMKIVGIIATRLGRRYQNDSCDKFIATTELLNPADFYVCRAMVYRYPMDGLKWEIALHHCLPAHPGHTSYPYEEYASVHLSNNGLIDLRAKPCFVPEAEDFEEPSPDTRFPQPREITREFFLSDHWLVRGPISSMGPRTQDFLYGFTNQAMGQILIA